MMLLVVVMVFRVNLVKLHYCNYATWTVLGQTHCSVCVTLSLGDKKPPTAQQNQYLGKHAAHTGILIRILDVSYKLIHVCPLACLPFGEAVWLCLQWVIVFCVNASLNQPHATYRWIDRNQEVCIGDRAAPPAAKLCLSFIFTIDSRSVQLI